MTSLPKIWIAGCGFLGCEIVRQASAQGCALHAITLTAESASELRSQLGISASVADLAQPASLQPLLELPAPSAIIHCASSGKGGAETYRQVYYQGCLNLLQIFPDSRLLFTSSTSVYPQTSGELVNEFSLAEPSRETGKILRETEDLVCAHGGIVARLAGLYGPGRSVLLARFLRGESHIETGVSRYLNQIHVADAAAAILTLLAHQEEIQGQVFNVADGDPLTQRECQERLANYFAKPLPPEKEPDLQRKRGWSHKMVSNQRLRKLGWSPNYPTFFDALERDPALVASIQRQP